MDFDATDNDVGLAGLVKYSITGNTFNISSTGEVTLSSMLDRESINNYTVIIRATDSAPSPFKLAGSHNLLVKIGDVNDNKPSFDNALSNINVPETESVGSSAFSVEASDLDVGVNGDIVYAIVSKNDTNNTFILFANNGTFILNCKYNFLLFNNCLELLHLKAKF